MDLGALLKNYAKEIGIDCLRFTSAAPLVTEEAILRNRVEVGLYPPFADPDITLRCHPERILPGCASLLVACMSYLSKEQNPISSVSRGWVSRYARGFDYHKVLRTKLNQLVTFLGDHVNQPHQYLISVDNGPCLERAVAVRAGLGWYGKNNLLYVPKLGSWVVLGVILTDVSLPVDPPLTPPSCDTCDLCLHVCPTNALTAPYTLDYKRCLAYITQMPGAIPYEYRRLLGRRVWGCDVCQTVCKWNRKMEIRSHPEWGAPLPPPDLLPLLTISKAEFSRRFGPSAMGWRGKPTLQRNAAIALGNTHAPQAIPALADRLRQDPKPVLRGACAWALGEIGGQQAEQVLSSAANTETDPSVQSEIQMALVRLRMPDAGK